MKPPIRILIVDDSALVRKLLTQMLQGELDIEVVGTAPDAFVAMEKIKRLQPDVLTLDLEMPRMDGLTFLRALMSDKPMPVVVISSIGQAGCEAAIEGLRLGAVEVLAKPGNPYSVRSLQDGLARTIRAAAQAKIGDCRNTPPPAIALPVSSAAPPELIAIGASTGGVQAITGLLQALPASAPGVVIAQHIPGSFSQSFADRLDRLCTVQVRQAQHLDEIEPGTVLVAPGDAHLVVRRSGSKLLAVLSSEPPRDYHRPSINMLFQSVAHSVGSAGLGVLLTGMGTDGARGLLEIRMAGGTAIAQDEASSVVFGMPREAIRIGAVERGTALSQIPGILLDRCGCLPLALG